MSHFQTIRALSRGERDQLEDTLTEIVAVMVALSTAKDIEYG